MTRLTADVVVIGCGGFGSAAVFHLTRRGFHVIGIDRRVPPHDRGSSHGQTRVIRKAYFEHPDYVPLLHRAYTLWDELQAESGKELFVRCGLLLAGPPEGEVIRGTRLAAKQHELDIQTLDAAAACTRFPQFRIPEDLAVAFEPDAGYLWAERCIETHLSLANTAGATFLFDQPVIEMTTQPEGIRLRTPDHDISAGAAVVTAGGWTGQLLPEFHRWIRIRRKTLFWFPCSGPRWSPSETPIHLFDLPPGQFYGFPSTDGLTVKVAEHTGGDDCTSADTIDRRVAPGESVRVGEYLQAHLREVEPVCGAASVCFYSMSPDGHFLLHHDPERHLTVGAGFSGHGFKFTSVLGEAMAEFIARGATGLPVGFLSPDRLQTPPD